MIQVLENRAEWEAHFAANWLKHFQETGETDFKLYQYAKNSEGVPGKAIDLSKRRLVFITTSGAYLKASQEPFDAASPLGDYTVRTFAIDTPLDAFAFAHDHYNHKYVDTDAQVLVPLQHLADMVRECKIGELAPQVISFSGYTPIIPRLLDEIIPQVITLVKDQLADAALLVPA